MSKKYYWLKLKSDFFDDDTIKYIEEQENGIKYSNFYLKLCLKSLKTDGKLIRLIGETLIPYDVSSLSKLTGVDFDIVRSAMDLFTKIGLIKVLESGELYLSQIDELIGSETDKAQIMRRIRAEKKLDGNIVTKMLPYIEKEIDKDIDIEKITKYYEANIGTLNPASAELIFSYLDDFNVDMIIEAIKLASVYNKKSTSYINGILKNWSNKGYKVLADIENEKQKGQTTEDRNKEIMRILEEAEKNGF